MNNNKIVYLRQDKTMHIMERFYTDNVISHIIKYIAKTNITPNMITSFNMLLSFLTLYLAYRKQSLIVAILVQVYVFLDNLDGILARYKNMKSKLGARLDIISDTIFYNGLFILLGYGEVNNIYLILTISIFNLYGAIATYYIVPRLKKLKFIKRDKFKRYFLEKGVIVGMNIDTAGIIITSLLLINKIILIYRIIILLFIIDLFYRLLELRYNEKLNGVI